MQVKVKSNHIKWNKNERGGSVNVCTHKKTYASYAKWTARLQRSWITMDEIGHYF